MNDGRRQTLVILGASARAAAMSALRSGFKPWAADRFGDLDLRAIAPMWLVEDYPSGLEQALEAAPPGPWIYTGALENRPELIERLNGDRTLYGIGGESLRAVRDPFRLAAALADAGLNAPQCASLPDGLPCDGSWLSKPFASAGGSGVRIWSGAPQTSSLKPQGFFQRRIDGAPVGAVFVAIRRKAVLLGVTRQLIGLDWCGLEPHEANRFRYCGSIGPLRLDWNETNQFERIGNTLADAFDLHGLFGVDAILSDSGIWPIEVNPRYTASVEVLEHALGIRSIALHVAACEKAAQRGKSPLSPLRLRRTKKGTVSNPPSDAPNGRQACFGKAILFAVADATVAPGFPHWCERQNRNRCRPRVADLPAAGAAIRAGQPIVTLLAAGRHETAALANLRSLAEMANDVVANGELCQTGQNFD